MDGKTCDDVVVQRVDADSVTILDSDGGARIDISKLPPDIQRRLNYDPALAADAAKERTIEEKYSEVAMENERVQANEIKQQNLETDAQTEEQAQARVANNNPNLILPNQISETRNVVDDNQYSLYQSDYENVRESIRINPVTHLTEGDPYWVRRYEEDRKYIEMYELQHEVHAVSYGQHYAPKGGTTVTTQNNRPIFGYQAPRPMGNSQQTGNQHQSQPKTQHSQPTPAASPPPIYHTTSAGPSSTPYYGPYGR